MDCPSCPAKRQKKSDKAKTKYEKYGGFSQKHIRQVEALQEKKKK
jgi:hypothetical protein